MWKWINPEIALGFLLSTVLWVAVLGWQTAYAPTELEKQACHDAAKKSGHKTEECKSIWEKTTTDPVAFFTFVLSVSTIGLWVVTWRSGVRQARDMEGAIAAAQEANKLSRENFAAGQRPWIAIESVEIGGPFRCDGRTASLPLIIKIKNVGQSPAFIIFPFLSGYHTSRTTNLLNVYEEFAAQVRTNHLGPRSVGGVLYPDKSRVLDHSVAVWHTQTLDEARRGEVQGPETFDPALIIDIDYTSSLRPRHYQTGLVIGVARKHPSGGGRLIGFDPNGGDVEAENIVLMLHPAGHFAD